MEGIHSCHANSVLPEVCDSLIMPKSFNTFYDSFCLSQTHVEASLPPHVIEHSNESSATPSLASAKDTGQASSLPQTPSYPSDGCTCVRSKCEVGCFRVFSLAICRPRWLTRSTQSCVATH
jgi:hypothetical protein